jgi:hypothetical protein
MPIDEFGNRCAVIKREKLLGKCVRMAAERAHRAKNSAVMSDIFRAELMETLLKALRKSAGHAEILILVEIGRLKMVDDVAGLIPKYRAMACSHDEMIQLVRCRLTSLTRRPRPAER